MVRVLMGCSILSMLFNLDLSLLEVLFIYSIKKGENDVFSLAAGLPSLQLVTDLPDSTKGGAKGHVLVLGVWAGLGYWSIQRDRFPQTVRWYFRVRQLMGFVRRSSVVLLILRLSNG